MAHLGMAAPAIGARDRSRSPHGLDAASTQEILQLVHAREQARKAKDFRLGDTYREQLQSLGVTLFDKTSSWRHSDGRQGKIPTWADLEAGETPETLLAAAEARESGLHEEGSEAHIRALVHSREQARAAKNFAESDRLRDELRAMGVELFDKEKMWKANSGLQGCILGYKGGVATDVEVSALVAQREKARQSGDWATADLIRTELKQAGCDVDDKLKTWKTHDGRTGIVPSWTNSPSSVMSGGVPSLAAPVAPSATAAVSTIQTQLLQAALVAAQNPATAARTLQVLQQAASTGVLSASSLLGAGPSASYGRAPVPTSRPSSAPVRPSSNNPDFNTALATVRDIKATGRFASDSEIMYVISVREKLRQDKDYGAADQLRDALRSELGVEMHEKEKRWSTTDGRQGEIPLWSNI